MSWRTFHSADRLAAWCEARRAGFDTVSFDLFDTLLVRRVHDPDLVKRPVARFIAERVAAAGAPARDPALVLRLRGALERRDRRRYAETLDSEACYPEFMAALLRRLAPGLPVAALEAMLKEVTEYELGLESRMLVPRAALRDCLERLGRAGTRRLVISDMYLPASHLARLIERAGLGPLVDGVVSSAETRRTKASGAAWPWVRERYGLDPARWLHVGDNPISDGLRPSAFGLQAAVLRDPGERARKAVARRYWDMAQVRPFWRGRLLQQLALPLESENGPRHPLYVAGYTVFAPLLCGFIHHVADQCRARGIRRVYFCSREGGLLRQIWERVAPSRFAGEPAPEARYLYVSRRALAGPACAARGLDAESAAIAFLPAANRDLRDLCRIFGLDPGALAPHLQRHRLRPDDVLSRAHAGWTPASARRFARLLADPAFQEAVRAQTRDAAAALQAYLAGERFFEQPDVALVDIGWLGTIQRFLFHAVAHRPDRPRLHGFVFALAGRFPFPASDDNRIEGFVFDRTRFEFAGSLIMTARELFEEVARASHPGLTAYRLEGGACRLEFRSDADAYASNERAQSAYFEPLRQGLLDAAERYGPAAALTGFSAEDLKPWLQALLVSRLAFPRPGEVALLRPRHHMDDFAGRHRPLERFRRSSSGVWDRPPWQVRLMPWLPLWEYLKHAVCMLRQ